MGHAESEPEERLCEGELEYIEPEVIHQGAQGFDVQLTTSKSGYLVVRESWYPGWAATVNGVTRPFVRAN